MSKFTSAQLKAIEARGNNYVVSAGAGSGKTTVLSERVLTLLRAGVRIDRMLILTFTVNAAFNMKAKIRSKMTSEPSLKHQLKYLEGADICTFDSFNQKIVRKYRTLLNLAADFSIADSSFIETKKQALLRKVFQKHYESHDPDFYQMLASYTLKDDSSLRELVLKIDAQASSTASYEQAIDELRRKVDDPNYVKTLYEKLSALVNDRLNSTLEDIDHLSFGNEAVTAFLKRYRSAIASLISSSFDEFKTKMAAFPRFVVPRGLEEEEKVPLQQLKKSVKTKLDYYCRMPTEANYLREIEKNRRFRIKLLELVNEYHESLTDFKRRTSVYEFNDIAHFAFQVLSEFPQVRREVAFSYDEIMVDEYQDNSDLQEALINLLEQRNLFLVGDVKQSIYRFRNANPALFISRYEKYRTGHEGEKIDMNENFRSSPSVIEEINDIFKEIMSLEFGGAAYSKEHVIIASNPIFKTVTDFKNSSLTYEHLKEYDYNEEEAAIIAADIISRLKGPERIEGRLLKYSDFAIIMDRGTAFDSYVEVFTRCGIPLIVDKDQDARELYVLDVIKNLFSAAHEIEKLLLNSSDLNSFKLKRCLVSLSRSFLLRISDDTIYKSVSNGDLESLEAFQKVEQAVKSTTGRSVFATYIALVTVFDLTAKIKTLSDVKENLAVLEAYSAIVKNLSNYGLSLGEMNDYFAALKADDIKVPLRLNFDVDDAVTLTNIHKSKGLEYNICYFSGLYKRYNEVDSMTEFICDQSYGIMLPLLESVEQNLNPARVLYLEKEKREDRAEKIRLLYVALTRTKYAYTLVFPTHETSAKEVDEASSFLDLLDRTECLKAAVNVVPDLHHKSETRAAEVKSKTDHRFTYRRLSEGKNLAAKPTRASKLTVHADERALKYGTHVHQVIESLDLTDPDYSSIEPELVPLVKRLCLRLQAFDLKRAQIYHEYEFYDEKRRSFGSVDLLLVYNEKIIVIDFKLKDIADEAYREQLNVYRENINAIFNRPVETYLYSLIGDELIKS